VDISQYDLGVTIINDGKYGHSLKIHHKFDGSQGRYISRFYDDEGLQEFSYAFIYVHGPCDVKDIVKRADNFNKKIIVFEGLLSQPKNLIDVKSDNFKILSYRKVNGKKVLRLCEQVGSTGNLEIIPEFSFSRVYLTNILEEDVREVHVNAGAIMVEYRPFKIYTMVIE